MDQKAIFNTLIEKGYNVENPIFRAIIEFLISYKKYDLSINYLSKNMKDDIELGKKYEMNLIIEPIVLPSVANALFIEMYGEFEFCLNQLCKSYYDAKQLDKDLNNIHGKGIYRAVEYLKEIVGLKKIKNSSEWNELIHWNRIRNIIVHNNGIIKESKEIQSVRFLNLNINKKYNRVYLTFNDCDRFQVVVINFIKLCI